MARSLTCFGVADGAACADRKHASFLYQLGQTPLLIDCGEPISASYKASGLGADLVEHILLSHLHFDHLGGFFMLLQGWWLDGRSKALTVHLPTWGLEPISLLLESCLFLAEQGIFQTDFVPWVGAETAMMGDVRVTAYPTTHMAYLRAALPRTPAAATESFSFLMETDERRIVHSADLGKPDDLGILLDQPLDLLVCELAHFEPVDLFRFLTGRAIKRLALVHIGGKYWPRRDELQALAAQMLPDVQVLIPNDGDVIDL
jgi:ribonuclease BN (tRNA processing enzyme)